MQIDETPKPEQHAQQLDVLLQYFSKKLQKVVVEHLQSFNLVLATASILVDCIEKSLTELPKNKPLRFFSDGLNTMKSVKKEPEQTMTPNLLVIGECNLHKVHDAFGTDVELLVINICYFFKHDILSLHLKEQQRDLGIPEHVFLQHVSNRWLPFQGSLERVLKQHQALKASFHVEAEAQQTSAVLQKQLAMALADKKTPAKMLFLWNTADLFSEHFKHFLTGKNPLFILSVRRLLTSSRSCWTA